jgi:hypothetical protein
MATSGSNAGVVRDGVGTSNVFDPTTDAGVGSDNYADLSKKCLMPKGLEMGLDRRRSN